MMKKKILNLIIVASSAIILIILIFFTNGIEEAYKLLFKIKYKWIVAGFACMLMHWMIGAFVLHIITRSLYKNQNILNSVKVSMVGHFFNSITPFASGGQPAQAYVMVMDGVKAGHAASILVIRSILKQMVMFCYTLFVFVLKSSFFEQRIPYFNFIFSFGLVANLSIISLYAMFLYNRELVKNILLLIFRFLGKFRFIKHIDEYKVKLENELKSFDDGAAILHNNIKLVVKTIILQIIQLTFLFAIPYFIYLAVELSRGSLWNMIAAQSLVTMIAGLVPSPGSTGGAESLSYIFFSLFFKSTPIIPVILIWRLITYYSNVVFGGLVSILSPKKPLKSN